MKRLLTPGGENPTTKEMQSLKLICLRNKKNKIENTWSHKVNTGHEFNKKL